MSRGKQRSGGTATKPWPIVALSLLVVALVAVLGALALQQQSRSAALANSTYTPAPIPTETHATLTLPPAGSDVLFLGDSWTLGYAAEPSSKGFAFLTAEHFGWNPVLDAASGSGFLNPGPERKGTYPERAAGTSLGAAPSMILIEGGLNDGSYDVTTYELTAITDTIKAYQSLYPSVPIVLMGPPPFLFPATPTMTRVDEITAQAAYLPGVFYMSPIREGWYTAESYNELIDATKGNHPTTAGHAMLAENVIADLEDLAETGVIQR